MSKHYEHLQGASGAKINFRAQRYQPKDLFDNNGPKTLIDGVDHSLLDISMSGLAALYRDQEHSEALIGREIPVRMLAGNSPLFAGHGRVVRLEKTKLGSKIAVNFIGDALDLDQLVRRYNDASFGAQIEFARSQSISRISPDYRLLCADTLHWLRINRAILTEYERNEFHGPGGQPEDVSILDKSTEQVILEWPRIQKEANLLTTPFFAQKRDMVAAKSVTESLLTPELTLGSVWHRSYHKPLGYPGDYLVMDDVYSGRDKGKSIYAKLLHRLGLVLLRPVVTRKDAIMNILRGEIERHAGNRAMRLTNLACGGAQELVELLQKNRSLPVSMDVRLIDQDINAIAYAYRRTYPLAVKRERKISIKGYQSSFVDLMNGGALSKYVPPQDFIYSIGLFDYLRQSRARALVESLYRHLAPGGRAVIANLRDCDISNRWVSEFICDWWMIYRTEEEMYDMAAGLGDAEVKVNLDASDQIWILSVRKPE